MRHSDMSLYPEATLVNKKQPLCVFVQTGTGTHEQERVLTLYPSNGRLPKQPPKQPLAANTATGAIFIWERTEGEKWHMCHPTCHGPDPD